VFAVAIVLASALPALTGAQEAGKQKAPLSITTPDGKRVVTANGNEVSIFDAQSQKELIRMVGHSAPVSALGMSPDGKLLATGGEDKGIGLWEMATGKLLLKLKVQATVTGLGISQDGKILTSREAGMITKMWDVATGQLIKANQ
jgi:WD40 repeat protein